MFLVKKRLHIFENQKCATMRQDIARKINVNNLKKKYQVSFRRWIIAGSGGGTISPYIGADLVFVREWLAKAFLPEMNWNNYGHVWVIDHVVPVRLFDLTSPEDLKIVWHYKNVMPLFKEDNLYKEGAIDFSLLILERLPPCEVTIKLKERLLQESERLKKYLQ